MSNELMIPAEDTLTVMGVDANTYIALKRSLFPGASDQSIQMVVAYCKAASLDLMQKPVHIVPVWSKEQGKMIDVVMPGISFYRTSAARSGKYLGKGEPEYGPEITEKMGGKSVTYPQWCKITVKKLITGHICEFTAKEFWKENYANAKDGSPNSMWSKRPYAQLAKCAEAQALRMAFPELTGGTPTAEEMEGKAIEGVWETVEHSTSSKNVEQIDISPISVEEIEKIRQMLADTRSNVDKFCAMFNVSQIEELTYQQLPHVMRALEQKTNSQKKKATLEINQLLEGLEPTVNELTLLPEEVGKEIDTKP